ncbi:hypothetical protein [Clostridium sp. CF012]|uniref:hypothetical protein n=1 Tax=Clostridium sp. CF012 TaxID=2843319 RepID=UPI001C0B6940|nr:hypothetical protein [Clostridium sp. CF012]MBU3146337.1 hypothetical protein [Clostridium sp. CF012]
MKPAIFLQLILMMKVGKKITFSVERSRAGNGAHIGFFFMERITALAANGS